MPSRLRWSFLGSSVSIVRILGALLFVAGLGIVALPAVIFHRSAHFNVVAAAVMIAMTATAGIALAASGLVCGLRGQSGLALQRRARVAMKASWLTLGALVISIASFIGGNVQGHADYYKDALRAAGVVASAKQSEYSQKSFAALTDEQSLSLGFAVADLVAGSSGGQFRWILVSTGSQKFLPSSFVAPTLDLLRSRGTVYLNDEEVPRTQEIRNDGGRLIGYIQGSRLTIDAESYDSQSRSIRLSVSWWYGELGGYGSSHYCKWTMATWECKRESAWVS